MPERAFLDILWRFYQIGQVVEMSSISIEEKNKGKDKSNGILATFLIEKTRIHPGNQESDLK